MNELELAGLTNEMREEFQIPPFCEDAQLVNLAKEGEKELWEHDGRRIQWSPWLKFWNLC